MNSPNTSPTMSKTKSIFDNDYTKNRISLDSDSIVNDAFGVKSAKETKLLAASVKSKGKNVVFEVPEIASDAKYDLRATHSTARRVSSKRCFSNESPYETPKRRQSRRITRQNPSSPIECSSTSQGDSPDGVVPELKEKPCLVIIHFDLE
jgi:hypothetical protein